MTPQLHSELKALSGLFYSGEISEEEWALLQIHMAYCDTCHQMFVQQRQRELLSKSLRVLRSAVARDPGTPEANERS